MAIYNKHDEGFELGKTENKSSKWPEHDSNLGPLDCKFRRADNLAMLPPVGVRHYFLLFVYENHKS